MFGRGCVALLSIPLTAQVLSVMPSSFHVSDGERIDVGFHSESSLALDRLRDATIHTGKLQYNVTNLRMVGDHVSGDARMPAKGTLVITARTLPNVVDRELRSQPGESAKPGRELASQYAKALVRSGIGDATYAKPVGFVIELVPENDPFSLKVGDRLPMRLFWKGKPAHGLMVMATHPGSAESYAVGLTDSEGRVYVTLNASGKWRLHAIAMERCADEQKADWESYWASLTFEIR